MRLFALSLFVLVGGNLPPFHLEHEKVFSFGAAEPNRAVLAAIDKLQATAPDGGGYFTGVKAVPAESPIGVPVKLFDQPLLTPPRTTSYCSGATYAALIGALDSLLQDRKSEVSAERIEAMRMQEPDGKRREDMVKLWGWWNADGPGSLFALVLYSHLGDRIGAMDAEPGDFCNIQWLKGPGHSVVFLGWESTPDGQLAMRYWSSQKGTNGMGDQVSPLSSMYGMIFTRLTHPENLLTFDPAKKMDKPKIEFDSATVVAERLKQRGGQASKTVAR